MDKYRQVISNICEKLDELYKYAKTLSLDFCPHCEKPIQITHSLGHKKEQLKEYIEKQINTLKEK